MNKKEKQSLIFYMRNILLFTILFIILSFVLIDIGAEYRSYLNKSAVLRSHIYSKQQLMVKTQVQKAAEIINLGMELAGDYSEEFNKELILKHLGKIRFGNKNEGYIFIVTYNGITILNDTQKDLVGKNLWDLTDPNGIKVIQEERKAAEITGGDFIEYSWEKPSTGKVSPKISYIIGIPDLEWMIGAGLYKDDIEEQLNSLKEELLDKIIFYILILFSASALILLLFFLLQRKLLQVIKNDISLFTQYFTNNTTPDKGIEKKRVHFSEFEQIAASINNMVQLQNKTEKEAVHHKKQFENLFSNIQDVVIITDRQRTIIDANQPALFNQLGYELNEIIGRNALILFNNYDDFFMTGKEFFDMEDENLNSRIFSSVYKKKNGELFPVEILAFHFEDSITGETLVASINRNITERVEIQNNLKSSLLEKELLLREVHHRVKNNMSIIIAFISLQAANTEDEFIKSTLDSTENRIRAMALVHELLYKDSNIITINMEEYLQILISDLLLNSGKRIEFSSSISDIELDLDTLIPLGLLVNEIVSNSIKHAYTESIAKPELSVSLRAAKNRTMLRIKDNGVGINSMYNYDKAETIGMVFIKTLTEQINGHMEISYKDGTEYTIIF